MRTRTFIIWFLALAAFVAYGRVMMRDVGYVYEEIFPHQRLLPDTLERVPMSDGWQLSHQDYKDPVEGCRTVLATQWPTFAVQCGAQVWPILSETYQGQWAYYLSLAWQAAFGNSLGSIRTLSGIIFALGLLLFFFVVRRESGKTTAVVSVVLLGTTTIYMSSSAFGFLYECVPMLLAVAAYGFWSRGQVGRPRRTLFIAGAAFCLSAAISLKATVGILVVPFGYLLWAQRDKLSGLKSGWGLVLGAALLPMVPFAAHELIAISMDSHSSILYTLSARGDLLGDASRLPSIILDSLFWLLAFGGNINSTSRPVFGVESLPWLRMDLVLLFVAACVWSTRRWARGEATMLERVSLIACVAAYWESVLLYATDTEIQTFLYVVPFLVTLNGRFYVWLASRMAQRFKEGGRARKETVVLAALVGLYAVQPAEVLLDSISPPHLMSSAAAERAICDGLDADDQVVTTNYNHIGAIEHCSDNRIRPVHAYFLLSPGSTGQQLQADLRFGVEYLLDRWPAHTYLFDAAPATVWEAREGSVLAGEEALTGLRLELFKAEVVRRGGTITTPVKGRNRRGETVLILLRVEWE